MAIILELLLREKECEWLQEHVLLFYHLSGYVFCIFYFLYLTFPLSWMQVVNPANWSSFFYTFVSRVSRMWSLKGLSKTIKLAGLQALLLASRREILRHPDMPDYRGRFITCVGLFPVGRQSLENYLFTFALLIKNLPSVFLFPAPSHMKN